MIVIQGSVPAGVVIVCDTPLINVLAGVGNPKYSQPSSLIACKNGGALAAAVSTISTFAQPNADSAYTATLALSATDFDTLGSVVLIVSDANNNIIGVLECDVFAAGFGGGGTDPWATAVPGAYGAGTAGFVLGTNLNTTVSSRSATGAQMDLVNAPNATALVAIATAAWALANGTETGYTPKQAMRLILSALAGKLAISGNTVTIRDVTDAKNRIIATTDTQGERTAITYDVS